MNKIKKQLLLAAIAIIVLISLLLHRQRPSISVVPESVKSDSSAQTKLPFPTPQASSGPRSTNTLLPAQEVQASRARTEQIKRDSEHEIELWQSPVRYFGKVVDENEAPISGVQVSYGANSLNELRQEVNNTGTVVTDTRGIFKIDGVRGIGLMLQLSHPNYYPSPDNSTGFDKRSVPKSGYFSDTEQKAELFRMHSRGKPVALIFREGGFHAPNNGSVSNFPLRGNTRSEVLGQLQIQGWSNLRSADNPYDWKVQLTMPEGGILETTNYFDFVAPESGFSESANIEVSGSENVRKMYFLKLPAGYIRFKLEVIMGKDMFVTGEYYFNPDHSPNLELDSNQIMRPTQ